jgi:hypothetical protein
MIDANDDVTSQHKRVLLPICTYCMIIIFCTVALALSAQLVACCLPPLKPNITSTITITIQSTQYTILNKHNSDELLMKRGCYNFKNNITLSDNMQSSVSDIIILALIISITTGKPTVPTPYPTFAPALTSTCTGSTAGWVDANGLDVAGMQRMISLAVPGMVTLAAMMQMENG